MEILGEAEASALFRRYLFKPTEEGFDAIFGDCVIGCGTKQVEPQEENVNVKPAQKESKPTLIRRPAPSKPVSKTKPVAKRPINKRRGLD